MQSEKRLRDDSEESRTDEYFDGALESTAHQEDETYSSQFMSILGLKADPLEDSKSRLIEEHDSFAQDGSDSSRMKSQDKTAVRELKPIDHASMVYRELRKNIYYPAPEIASLSEAEVDEIRKQADNTKVKGRDVPNPIETWSQCGFDSTIISELMRRNFSVPFPIQKQCIPILLSGRDVLAIAQTGSGKTLAYVLPLIRHVLCQPPVQSREGPIAVVLLCTRELAIQVGHTISAYVQVLTANNIRVGIFYGGSPISENIAVCKSDIQIAVTTPGRWYDLLTANRGRVTNLTRVSFIIIDEADRMFDDGFFPQITKILRNVRPDKQIGMFTATLPAFICKMATQMLVDPIVVKIGSRLSVAKNVKQTVEIFKQKQHRFLRLLQILGQWDESLTLIFTETKNEADELFMRLKELQYNSCLLHSGMDQIDRQFSLYEFRSTRKNIMVATGVAARGIDVLNLDLVINFTTPRSYEEYIHRVGRTGRAGKMGTAFTLMLIPEDDKFASYLVQTLDSSENPIPDELQELASLQMKCKDKNALVLRQSHTNTYSGRGFRFDAKEAHETKKRRREAQREQMKLMNLEYSDSTSQDESEDATLDQYFRDQSNQEYDSKDAHNVIQDVIHKTGKEIALKSGDVTSRALALVDALNAVKDREDELAARGIFVREIDVNDLSARIRSKVCKRDNLSDIMRETKTVISIRGEYIPSNMKKMRPGTKRMRLHIEGSDEQGIREAQEKIYAFIANEENIIQANVRL